MLPSFELNYLAVAAAAVVTFLIGAVWYSPLLFAKAWMKAHDYVEADLARLRKSAGRAYAFSFPAYVVVAAAIGVLVYYLNLRRADQGVQLGLLLWGGIVAPLGLIAHLFSEQKLSAWLIDASYQLVYLLAMASILTLWR